MPTGKIRYFNQAAGLGSIEPDEESSDVFFEESVVVGGGVLVANDRVRYEAHENEATRVEKI